MLNPVCSDVLPQCSLNNIAVENPVEPRPRIHDHQAKLQAADVLLPAVYDDMLRLARTRLARFRPMEILAPSELVHEVYVRLSERRHSRFEGSRHLFFAAARAMGDILVERCRQQASLKRGGGVAVVTLDIANMTVEAPACRSFDLAHALEQLERECPQSAQVVRLSFFYGFTHPEVGEVMGISRATVERRWASARIWLRRELSTERGSSTQRRNRACVEGFEARSAA